MREKNWKFGTYRIFKQRRLSRVYANLRCQCTVLSELSLLALNSDPVYCPSNKREKKKSGNVVLMSHFKATMAQSRLCQCTDSPVISLLASNEKNMEICYLLHFKATKAQRSSLCQCTDSPAPSLLA